MPRGGYREGSGGRPTWKHGKTKPIRVPVALAEEIIEIARRLDEARDFGDVRLSRPSTVDSVAESKVVDLSGIAILHSKDGPVVRLVDLLRAGYEIRPERLARRLKAAAERDLKVKGDLESFIQEFHEK